MSDEQRLSGYVDIWWHAVEEFTKVLEQVPDDAWDRPTDLPGWSVRAVAAHTAHLESGMAGVPHDQVDIGEPPHVHGIMGVYTEQGVVARQNRTPEELITELRECTTKRHTQLLAQPPADAQATADGFAGLLGWSWERLLRNRPLDVWMHEQDVRRAIGLPGGLDTPAALHSADYLLESLRLVVGKRVAPPAGTVVVVDVDGSRPYAVRVGEDGRAAALPEVPPSPTVNLAMSREDFIVAAGGRRAPLHVEITGDQELGAAVLAHLAVTP